MGGLGDVDTQSCGCRRQECGRVLNHAPIRRLPPQPNVLHDILGFRCISEHSVGDAEQTRSHVEKCQKTVVVFTGL